MKRFQTVGTKRTQMFENVMELGWVFKLSDLLWGWIRCRCVFFQYGGFYFPPRCRLDWIYLHLGNRSRPRKTKWPSSTYCSSKLCLETKSTIHTTCLEQSVFQSLNIYFYRNIYFLTEKTPILFISVDINNKLIFSAACESVSSCIDCRQVIIFFLFVTGCNGAN